MGLSVVDNGERRAIDPFRSLTVRVKLSKGQGG